MNRLQKRVDSTSVCRRRRRRRRGRRGRGRERREEGMDEETRRKRCKEREKERRGSRNHPPPQNTAKGERINHHQEPTHPLLLLALFPTFSQIAEQPDK